MKVAHYIKFGNWENVHPDTLNNIIIGLGRHIDSGETLRAFLCFYLSTQYPQAPIIFTGHNGEAQKMYQKALALGLNKEHPVILETEASNMRENFELSYSIITSLEIPLQQLTVIVASCLFCAPRAFLTFRRLFPNVLIATEQIENITQHCNMFLENELTIIIKYPYQFFSPTKPVNNNFPVFYKITNEPQSFFTQFFKQGNVILIPLPKN